MQRIPNYKLEKHYQNNRSEILITTICWMNVIRILPIDVGSARIYENIVYKNTVDLLFHETIMMFHSLCQ